MNPEAARWLPREKRGWYFALRRLQGEEALVYFCPHAAASSVYSLHPPGGLFRTLPLPMVRRQGQNLLFCDPRGRPRLRCSLPPPGGGWVRGCGIDDPRAQFLLRALPPPNLRRNQALAVQLQARLSALQWQACRTDPDEFFAACRDPQLRTLGAAWTRRDNLVYFPWRQAFLDYMESHDLRDQIRHLKEGLDEISCGYVDHFLKLAAYWERSDYAGSLWTDYDLRKRRQFIAFLKHFVQPCPELTELNPYYFFDNYGLADLPAPLRQGLAGKLIIDGGAYTGDTALAFRQHFPEAHIHAYEPGPVHATLSALLARGLGQGRITAYQQGLAAAATALAVRGCYGVRQAQCTTIDAAYAARRSAVGLIKLDTESCELEILRGARQVVAEDKPLLAVAMYHDPRDFFALREWLEEIRPDYRFMIRRSELSLPQADLVLVAY